MSNAVTPAPCPGCSKTKRIHSRGLCRACYDDTGKRESRPNNRNWRRSPDRPNANVGVRNAILCDPVRCPPSAVRTLACLVLRRFTKSARRIDPDDLAQEAWLVLIRSAETWRPDKGAGSVVGYANQGIRSAMTRYAAKEVRMETVDVQEHEEVMSCRN
jgi:hypothetical protein